MGSEDEPVLRAIKWRYVADGSRTPPFEARTLLLSSPLTMVLGKTLGLTQVLTRSVAKRDRRLKPVGVSLE